MGWSLCSFWRKICGKSFFLQISSPINKNLIYWVQSGVDIKASRRILQLGKRTIARLEFCRSRTQERHRGSPDRRSTQTRPQVFAISVFMILFFWLLFYYRMGFYFSLLEWFNPVYLKDKRKPYGTQFVDTILLPQLKELVCKYLPDIIWYHTSTYTKYRLFLFP